MLHHRPRRALHSPWIVRRSCCCVSRKHSRRNVNNARRNSKFIYFIHFIYVYTYLSTYIYIYSYFILGSYFYTCNLLQILWRFEVFAMVLLKICNAYFNIAFYRFRTIYVYVHIYINGKS